MTKTVLTLLAVAFVIFGVLSPGYTSAFLYSDGTYTTIAFLGISSANGINDAGQIFGG